MKRKGLAQQIIELRTEAQKPGAQDVEAMGNRVMALDLLYEAARRDDPENHLHARYTGLWSGNVPF